MELSSKANPAKNDFTKITNCIKKGVAKTISRHNKIYTIRTRLSKSKHLNLKSIFKRFLNQHFSLAHSPKAGIETIRQEQVFITKETECGKEPNRNYINEK